MKKTAYEYVEKMLVNRLAPIVAEFNK